MSAVSRKLEVIDKIIRLQNEAILEEIEALLRVVEQQMARIEVDPLKNLVKPISKTLDIEALKRAKGYKGVNRPRFNRLIKELNITEPIELLLNQLKE
jgi:hypothetical protein